MTSWGLIKVRTFFFINREMIYVLHLANWNPLQSDHEMGNGCMCNEVMVLTNTRANLRSNSEAIGIGWRFLLLILGCRMWFAINVDDGELIKSLLQSMKISWRSFALLLFKLSFPLANIEPILILFYYSKLFFLFFLLIVQIYLLFWFFFSVWLFFFMCFVITKFVLVPTLKLISCFTVAWFKFHSKAQNWCVFTFCLSFRLETF